MIARPLLRLMSALVIGMAALASSGCASLLEPRAADNVAQESWTGRFALTVEPSADHPDGQRSTGSFELTSGKTFNELELLSPLGNTLASARTDARGAVLRTADGKSYDAANADQLTERVFGWRIPVDKLPNWLRGNVAQVVQTAPAVDGGPSRPLTGVEEGWQIRFETWEERASDARPLRLVITYPNRVLLRLIVAARPS